MRRATKGTAYQKKKKKKYVGEAAPREHEINSWVYTTYLAKPAYTLAHSTSKLLNESAQTELIIHGQPRSEATVPEMNTPPKFPHSAPDCTAMTELSI